MPYIHDQDSLRIGINSTLVDTGIMEIDNNKIVVWIDKSNFDQNTMEVVGYCQSNFCNIGFCDSKGNIS